MNLLRQIFIFESGQILKNNQTILSHWLQHECFSYSHTCMLCTSSWLTFGRFSLKTFGDDIMNSLNAKTNGYIQLTQALISSKVYPVNFPAKTGSFDHKKIRNRVTTILWNNALKHVASLAKSNHGAFSSIIITFSEIYWWEWLQLQDMT